MGFSFDINNKLKQSKMFLANPQKSYIGTISGAKNVKLKLNFNSLHELTFNIYENENNEDTEYYDKIIKMRLIELQNIGWFQIQTAVEKQDESSLKTYKEVKCYSLENELIYKKVYDIVGVFSLYDISDTSHSLLHIISEATGYNIDHIDNNLLGKWRTFDIASEQVYNLMTQTLSKSFECVFTFDTYSRSINCYELANIGSLTDIVISKKNILKEYIRDDGDSCIITKLRISGGDDLDIRSINPSGTNYRINLDYFMTTEWGIKQTTIDAWNSYKTKSSNVSILYSSTLDTLKTKNSELLVLNTQLTDLQALLIAQEDVKGSCMEIYNPPRSPISSDTNYTLYQNAISLMNTYTSQIASKKSAIISKKSEISVLESTLNGISVDLDWSTNFTTEQIAEINMFITEDQDYSDSTFTETTTMNSVEVMEMKLELLQNGDNELARASQPQFTYTTNVSNLLTLCDDKDDLVKYIELRSQLQLGNLITIIFRDDYNTTVRLMSLLIDFDNPENLDLVFSDKSRLDDALIQLAEVISTSGKAATSYSVNKYGYDNARSITNEVREFMNGSLNATNNRVFSDDNVQTELGKYGIINRKWLPDQNKYDDRQSLLTQNVLLFTDDNWVSSKSGIGYFTNTLNETYYGVLADIICGDLVLTSALNISNQNNSIIMNKDGAVFTNCDITINKGTNSIRLNASEGIQIFNGITKQFYIDIDGNVTSAGKIIGGSMNINNKFIVDSSGNLTANNVNIVSGTFSGTLSSGVSITSPIINGGSITGTSINSTGLNYTTSIDGGVITTNLITMSGGGESTNIVPNGIFFSDDLRSSYMIASELSIRAINDVVYLNGGTPITTDNATTNKIYASNTGYGNLDFLGFDNACGVNYAQATFAPIGASDFRLKYNIQSLDSIPDELFYSLKPKQFKYKTSTYGDGVFFGLIAQQVENAFLNHNLNPYDYDLIDVKDVRKYTDDGYYVDDKTHRIRYNNLISWMINIIQKQNIRIINLESSYNN